METILETILWVAVGLGELVVIFLYGYAVVTGRLWDR